MDYNFHLQNYLMKQDEKLENFLKDVLKKVSGDPDIDRDSRVEGFAGQAQTYVKAFKYHDRMEGIPIQPAPN